MKKDQKDISEIEQKKEYLRGYEKAQRQMERSELRIKEMRLNQICPSVINDGMPHASSQNDLSSYAALLDQEEKMYMWYRYQCTIKCQAIKYKIKQLPNENEKNILMYKYIRLLSFDKIAEKMKKSYRQILRIHKNALEHFIV